MAHSLFGTLKRFDPGGGAEALYYCLPQLEEAGIGRVSRLPVSIRVVLESVLRNYDGAKVTEEHVRALANWAPQEERVSEVPFVVARILLQDFTGIPLLVDLAAMRSAAARSGYDARIVEPLVNVDLVIDHSVQVDFWSRRDALELNAEMEMKRNRRRYEFLKWGQQAFHGFNVVPPEIGICHQVNLEYLARGVMEKDGIYYPDTLVGTDSHTTMINGLGVVGWGVGGIEAEAGMLGQPLYILMPDVIGVHLVGALREGVVSTDLVLNIAQMLRQTNVVGKFVEFYGEGAESLSVPDRATISNMSPEYGATMCYFPVDEKSLDYYRATGRGEEQIAAIRNYFTAQGLFGMPRAGAIDYTQVLELDLATVRPSVSGPRRPQDRIDLPDLKSAFLDLLSKPVTENGYGKTPEEIGKRYPTTLDLDGSVSDPIQGGGAQASDSVPESKLEESEEGTNVLTEIEMMNNRPTPNLIKPPSQPQAQRADGQGRVEIGNGDVLIASITSCTNTSNPTVMLSAGLLAKKAVERGLSVKPWVKPSLGPGSRVVTDYFRRTGLEPYLEKLGFHTVGYGCITCIGNSGPLDPRIEETVTNNDLIGVSVLSGNRNFEARIHQSIRANFLMSPPLVIAFALAGRIQIDMENEPIGQGSNGEDVYLRDLWPTPEELERALEVADDPELYRQRYANVYEENARWNAIVSSAGLVYDWDPESTYIREPPYFAGFALEPEAIRDVRGARLLALFGDSITTDHISPAGAIKRDSAAGLYLQALGVRVDEFNTYGARRGNHEVMVRGTFANVRIRNRMVPGTEGGITVHQPSGVRMKIYDAAVQYEAEGVPLLIIAGREYGAGSSRDWAAKGTRLLGVRAVVAESFERIHRSNLVGMGVLPCQFEEGVSARSLGLDGSESFDLLGIEGGIEPRKQLRLVIHRADGGRDEARVRLQIETQIEVDYYQHGGILPYLLRQLIKGAGKESASVKRGGPQ